jgi:nitroreductase
MEFSELINRRQSIRLYKEAPVPEEALRRVLQAANAAPSAGNRQAYEIYLVRNTEKRKLLVQAAGNQEFLAQAPITLFFCANPRRNAERYGERGESLYAVQDATIACTYAMLAAANEGLGTVWVGAFDERAVTQLLDLPEGLRAVAMLPIGYAAETPARRGRRRLEDLVHSVD